MLDKSAKKRDNVIYGTILVLAIGFLVLVGLVFVLSDSFSISGGKCVAVVNINNPLSIEGSPESLLSSALPSSEEIANKIEELDKREDVGAVVFVINSPGGSVVASREIYTSIVNLSKPKVGYFREVAASGAYYISTPLDYIISDPATLTGSIGVIITFSDLSGLFEKIGYNSTSIKSGELKDIGSSDRPITDKEREIIQAAVDEIFEDFKSIVLKHRGSKLNKAKFEEILDGRVITGKQAKAIGLVDELGNKKDAINKARELAGLPEDAPTCEISVVSSSSGLFGINSLFSPSSSKGIEVKFQ